MKPISNLSLAMACIFFFQSTYAQKQFTATAVNSEQSVQLRSHFSKYSLFSINTAEITDYARKQKTSKTDFSLQLPGFSNWKFSLAEHDILSKDYKLVVNSPEGQTLLPRPACMTYAGYLSDVSDSRVRLTIDNNVIYGIIKSGGNEYFIEPLRYLDKQAASDVFVVYDVKDISPDPNITCGVKETEERTSSVQRLMAGTNCVQTELAIASDESMFIRYGSAAAVQTHNIGVMNNVIWDYVNGQFTDNIEFVIVTQNVSTSAVTDQLSPAYAGTNSNTILPNFRTWGNAGNFGVTYDLAQFWTTRNIDMDGAGGGSGTVGLAYRPGVCGASRYHILEDFTGSNPSGSGYQLRVLTTHEIGHNFNITHDGAGSGFIMAPSVNNTDTWSAASITIADAFVPGSGCLGSCSSAGVPVADFIATPEAICTGGTLQLTDHSLRGPTSWSWTLTGGSPTSSTIRNPTVSYATSGVKTISLTSTNGGGSGSPINKLVLVSDPSATACTNTGAIASEGGIRSFSLNTINRISGSAAGDGDKYMDFSCSDITSLVANTLYQAIVNVGFSSPTDPTPPHIFNHILFYIDYNNDGDFADAGENVYSSGGTAYRGSVAFNFTTPVTPPVTNQFLRARIIARDFGGATGSCLNPAAGQVEDYAVYFASGVLLPVTLIDFDGYHYNGNNILNWQTAEEKENSHFEIERSVTGTTFESIGRIDGAGTSNTISRYTFTDHLDASFINNSRLYYRLKITSLSGKSEYSKTITITTKTGKTGLVVNLQPNPFTNTIAATVQLKEATTMNMQLIDMTGRIIYRDQKRLPAGIHSISYNNFENLAKGTYIIKITADNETISRLMEKQ
ncbi:MAG TPA: GEVED domain-containing protein [Chitinophagaceae bacterium]